MHVLFVFIHPPFWGGYFFRLSHLLAKTVVFNMLPFHLHKFACKTRVKVPCFGTGRTHTQAGTNNPSVICNYCQFMWKVDTIWTSVKFHYRFYKGWQGQRFYKGWQGQNYSKSKFIERQNWYIFISKTCMYGLQDNRLIDISWYIDLMQRNDAYCTDAWHIFYNTLWLIYYYITWTFN